MATKKTPRPNSKGKPQQPSQGRSQLQNLAARPPSFDDEVGDEQLVDHSGVFRVTTKLSQSAQSGRDEDSLLRFPNDSLVMAAQRDGFRDEGPTLDESADEADIAAEAEKRQRLATLAARARAARNRSRR